MYKLFCQIALVLLALVVATPTAHACGSEPPGYGFVIAPAFEFEGVPFIVIEYSPIPGIGVSGTFVSGDSGFSGSETSFSGTTNSAGTLSELGKASPAHWHLSFTGSVCNGQSGTVNLLANAFPQVWVCEVIEFDDMGISPSSYVSGSGQTTMSMSSSSAWFDTPYQYGYYNSNGDLDQTGYVTVTDNYDCWGYVTPDNDGSGSTYYIVLEDVNSLQIAYGTITVD